jgi:hypothetical protein
MKSTNEIKDVGRFNIYYDDDTTLKRQIGEFLYMIGQNFAKEVASNYRDGNYIFNKNEDGFYMLINKIHTSIRKSNHSINQFKIPFERFELSHKSHKGKLLKDKICFKIKNNSINEYSSDGNQVINIGLHLLLFGTSDKSEIAKFKSNKSYLDDSIRTEIENKWSTVDISVKNIPMFKMIWHIDNNIVLAPYYKQYKKNPPIEALYPSLGFLGYI